MDFETKPLFFTIFDLVNWNLWKKKPEYHLITLDLNILDRFEVDFHVSIVKVGEFTCTFCCVQYSSEHARMEMTHFIYLQLTICWQIITTNIQRQ